MNKEHKSYGLLVGVSRYDLQGLGADATCRTEDGDLFGLSPSPSPVREGSGNLLLLGKYIHI